jgi:hypothetical protein
MHIIPTTQEAKAEGYEIQGQIWQFSKILSQKIERIGECNSVVAHLSNMHKALGSITSFVKINTSMNK